MFWLSIEWTGSILGLLGAYLLANKDIKPYNAWVVWLVSDILFISLFALHTGQHGLLVMNLFGATTCILGIRNWKNPKRQPNPVIQRIMLMLSLTALGLAIIALSGMPFIEKPIKSIEWFGSLLSISGGFLMASKHKLSPLSWITWTVANAVILLLTLHTSQYGVAVLQAGFTLLNVYGCYTWLYKQKFFCKLRKARSLNRNTAIA